MGSEGRRSLITLSMCGRRWAAKVHQHQSQLRPTSKTRTLEVSLIQRLNLLEKPLVQSFRQVADRGILCFPPAARAAAFSENIRLMHIFVEARAYY
jgi:hypothetical protein